MRPRRSPTAATVRQPASRLERVMLPLACWLLAALAIVAAAPASARVEAAAADGFVSVNEAVVPGPPDRLWAALVPWDRWWDPAHSYSGKAGAIRLDLKPGGLLHEQWPGGSVAHAQVVNALPPALLRLNGGFGPLQALPVSAVLDFTLKAEGGATRLAMTYRVAGSPASKLDTLAAPVDAVMSAGFARLVNFATTGKP